MLLFGMATHLTKLVRSADVKQEIDLLREAGVTAIRTGFLWDRIEPVEGELHFDPVDEVVDLLRAAGIEILGTIARTPIWAGGDEKDGCFRFHPPREPEKFAAFSGKLAAHYCGRISAWEIWNEPNSNNFWYPEANPESYMTLLRAAFNAIKEMAPETLVLHGGVACCREQRINFAFLEQLFRLGVADCCDVVNVHPYSGPNVPEVEFDATFDRLAELMHRYHCSKPVWLTELGTPIHHRFVRNETEQAFHLVRHWLCAVKRPEIERIYWYDFRDDGTDPENFEHHFGVIDAGFRRKEAYFACREVTQRLSSAAYRGEFILPDGSRVIRFRQSEEEEWFLLYADSMHTRLLAGIDYGISLFSMTGSPLPLYQKGNTIDLTIGPEPVRIAVSAENGDRILQSLRNSVPLIGI